jgi:cutinase
MKLLIATSLAAAAVASPTIFDVHTVQKRQGCGPTFVFARGSMEPAPIGMIIGPGLEKSLKKNLPGVKTIAVTYGADLLTNLSADRTDAGSTKEGVKAFEKAYKDCPSGIIVAGGYSQGAAVMHNAVAKSVSDEIKAKIAGIVLYGDTRNKQDGGKIPNFPAERVKVFCNKDDGVCGGGLGVNGGHFAYPQPTLDEGAKWLSDQVSKHKSGKLTQPNSTGGTWNSGGGGGGGKGAGGSPPKGKSGGAPKGKAPGGGGAPKGKGGAPKAPKGKGSDDAPKGKGSDDAPPADMAGMDHDNM